jgi:hypothetical protein
MGCSDGGELVWCQSAELADLLGMSLALRLKLGFTCQQDGYSRFVLLGSRRCINVSRRTITMYLDTMSFQD